MASRKSRVTQLCDFMCQPRPLWPAPPRSDESRREGIGLLVGHFPSRREPRQPPSAPSPANQLGPVCLSVLPWCPCFGLRLSLIWNGPLTSRTFPACCARHPDLRRATDFPRLSLCVRDAPTHASLATSLFSTAVGLSRRNAP